MSRPAAPAKAWLGAVIGAPRAGIASPLIPTSDVRAVPTSGPRAAAAVPRDAPTVHVEAPVLREVAALLAHDALRPTANGRPKVAPGRPTPSDPSDPAVLARGPAVPSLATAAGKAVVATRRQGAVVPLQPIARRPIPVGLTERLALVAAAVGPGGVTEGVVLLGGEAALAPVVVAAGPTTRTNTGLVQPTRPSTARVAIHVGRRSVARPRAASPT